MANNISEFKQVPVMSSRYCELIQKYSGHSIMARAANALRYGRDTIEVYRPRAAVRSVHITDEILELVQICGCKVTMVPSSNTNISLYVVSNLSSLIGGK